MKYATERYITIKHPHRIGVTIQAVATGKKRTSDTGRVEAEVRVISPQANLDTYWITREEVIPKQSE